MTEEYKVKPTQLDSGKDTPDTFRDVLVLFEIHPTRSRVFSIAWYCGKGEWYIYRRGSFSGYTANINPDAKDGWKIKVIAWSELPNKSEFAEATQ